MEKKYQNITGLNESHPLFSDITTFIDFGDTVRELVSDSVITTTAPVVEDEDMGTVRAFSQDSHQPNSNIDISHGSTFILIRRYTGNYLQSTNSRLRYADLFASNIFRVMDDGFGSNQFSVRFRSDGGTELSHSMQPYSGGAYSLPQGVPEVVVVPVRFDVPYSVFINNTEIDSPASEGLAETDYPTSTVSVPILNHFGAQASANVAAMIVIDRFLTNQEIEDISNDPWVLTNGNPPAEFTIADDQSNPASTLVFGDTYTITTTAWGNAPTHVDIVAGGVTLTLPVTSVGGDDYTFTMPSLPAELGATVQAVQTGSATIRLYTDE